MKKLQILPVLGLALLSACAMPIASHDMKPLTEVHLQLATNPKFASKVAVGNVAIGEDAKLYGAVTPEAYKDALQSALLTSNYISRAGSANQYLLDATLNEIETPFMGFNLDCYATATYRLRSYATGQVIAEDTVKSHYEARFGEAFNGDERMRLCVAKSIRENITHYLRLLTAK